MLRVCKLLVLHICKYTGLFALSRWYTRGALRIICYHGLALADEYEFRPKLFMSQRSFRKRMEWLKKSGYRMVELTEGLDALARGSPVDYNACITMDDGWQGVYSKALPVLSELSIPATVYITTYYVAKGTIVYNTYIRYLFWRAGITTVNLPFGTFSEDQLCDYVGSREIAERERLLAEFVNHLGFSDSARREHRLWHLLNVEEIKALDAAGIDIQLHTHRHRWGNESDIVREITDNRSCLEPLVSRPLEHFCYPSGRYDRALWPSMNDLGIKSATTLKSGLNYKDTPRYELRRIVDGENVTTIEFEAEISGFLDILRGAAFGKPDGGAGGPAVVPALKNEEDMSYVNDQALVHTKHRIDTLESRPSIVD